MDKKFEDFLSCLKYEEMLDIRQDLSAGGRRIRNIVSKKITEFENSHRKTCSVCLNHIEPESTSNYTLIFGPESFKKKATFCAVDCLTYFLQQLKQIKTLTKEKIA